MDNNYEEKKTEMNTVYIHTYIDYIEEEREIRIQHENKKKKKEIKIIIHINYTQEVSTIHYNSTILYTSKNGFAKGRGIKKKGIMEKANENPLSNAAGS